LIYPDPTLTFSNDYIYVPYEYGYDPIPGFPFIIVPNTVVYDCESLRTS